MAYPNYGSQAQVTGNALAISIFSSVDPQFLDVQYPERLWQKIIPESQRNTSVNAGAQTHVRRTKDRQGAAAFTSQLAGDNIPRVGVSIGAIASPLAVSAVGADIHNEDARQYEFGNLGSLPQDLQSAMVEAAANLVEVTVIFGDPTVEFLGWLNYPQVSVNAVGQNGTGVGFAWTTKTPYFIWYDVQVAIAAMYNNTNTLFIPDTIYLPPSQFMLLQQPMVIGGTSVAVSIFEYIKKNNGYTAITCKELKIEPIRYLTGAGSGGMDRMVVQCHDDKYQEIALPLALTMQAPIPIALGAAIFAEQKHGTYCNYQPATMAYWDGI